MTPDTSLAARRQFLKYLSASPYVASAGGFAALLQTDSRAQDIRSSSFTSIMRDRMSVVDNPKDALTVFDFEATARTKVNQGHWAYMASGTDDDTQAKIAWRPISEGYDGGVRTIGAHWKWTGASPPIR